jgi:AcrR family transcriptional regulator
MLKDSIAQRPKAAGAKKKRPDVATVDRLLDTAAVLFWRKGFAATTTREIATALDIQQASLYYHMASKEDLLYQLCVSSLQDSLSSIPPALEGVTEPLERIRVLTRTHVSTLLRRQERNAAMLTELRALSSRHRVEVVELRARYMGIVRGELEAAQGAGAIRSDIPATYLGLALLNMLNWSSLWFRKGQALSVEPLGELFADIYLNGVTLAGHRNSIHAPGLKQQAKKPAPRPRSVPQTQSNPTVERLLKAAVALFSRNGYTATSTREVAALLGMQKASLYYHIEGKEDLLYFICRSSLEQIKSDVEQAIQNVSDPLERVRMLILAHIESMLRDAEEHSTTLAEMHALSPDRFAQVRALRDSYEDLVRSILQEAQRAQVLREDLDVKYVCLSLLGLMNRVLVWYRRRGPLAPNQLGELLAAIFLTGAAVHRD